MTSSNPTPRTVNELRREIETERSIFHATTLKTPQSKLNTSVLISATATRGGNGSRSAVTPRVGDEASHVSQGSAVRLARAASSTPLLPSRRLPMNMVVSQIARRRGASPVREIKEMTQRVASETPPLDPFLEQLLSFRAPGPKTGSLPHPDDLMGAKLRKFRKQEGPEDDIHRAFIAVYGDAEANLSARKKLRLARGHDEAEEPLPVTPCRPEPRYQSPVPTRTRLVEAPWQGHSPVRRSPDVTPANSHYLELYRGVSQRACAEPPRSLPEETWSVLESSPPPPRKFVSSHDFLRTVSQVNRYESSAIDNRSYHSPTPHHHPQESSWKKYLPENQEEEEKENNSWVIESRGNSNEDHRYNSGSSSSNTYNYYVKNDEFKPCFVLNNYGYDSVPSPALPGVSPELSHGSRMLRGNTAVRSSTRSSLPESARCSWLDEGSPPPIEAHPRRYQQTREQRDAVPRCLEEENDEIASFLQEEKESISASTPDCDAEDQQQCTPEE